MNITEILDEVYKLLEDPKHWTRGALARDSHSRKVPPWSNRACKWCLTGAPYKVIGYRSPNIFLVVRLLQDTMPTAFEDSNKAVFECNDDKHLKHPDVLLWVKRARALAVERGL